MGTEEWISAGTLEQLKADGAKVIKGGIAVFAHENGAAAVDNRCPHLGFPLHLGSLCNGILTCHWHHARFDLCSGGTLDPWADDALAHDVKIENGEVWVNKAPRHAMTIEKLNQRLREGLEQNIGIVIAKAVVGLIEAGVSEDEIVRVGILYGTSQSGGWGSGLTILAAMRNALPKLDKSGRILALYHGLAHVAREGVGRPPRRLLGALPSADISAGRLAAWYRSCTEVRDTQGAEKVLLTAISAGISPEQLADMMLIAVTDHFYLDGGHTFDFHNKAFETLEAIGPDAAESILAALTPLLRNPSRSEEQHHWQSPVDLVTPLNQTFERLQREGVSRRAAASNAAFDEEAFVEQLLGDQPLATIRQIADFLLNGIAPARLARLIALAAAERIVRFHTQNDFGDWLAVLHTFTYAHAVHERLLRSEEPLLHRALFYGAIAIYHDRFLNVPRAPKPKKDEYMKGMAEALTEDLLTLLDRRQQVEEAAGWVAAYLDSRRDRAPLLNTLGHCLLREDAEFHSFQMYEAAIAEYEHWYSLRGTEALADRAANTMLIACARYLAAHAPTAREMPHTARIAWRLHRGERLFESE
ncbi:Rieske (2Fe-2S) protein [Paenibacillaceae bacterium WGS1546]|uniref:Rieske (2Fe-2S) protein n=1 Tax=Cohnella sp. WGS1546 TaxID=3366810 RepID=UPI00372CF01B